ncbi:MAG: TauD/TfdA family dioxygenase, partial [Rubrivivax sp.]|nr:TauD/TfdA family dioxygenase [Rubrivivax sp.]
TASDGRGGFIPYTDRAIRWHTDGYYHPAERRIRGMILHCVRPAASGGVNGLLDHELAYLRLRDLSPAHVRALMQPDVMTIPARTDDDGVARAAQSGPVFSVDDDGCLHMRYTARTRSIEWTDNAATRAAVAALEAVLAADASGVFHLRLQPGMGIVGHNVLHDRTGFSDDPLHPRLLYRARFLDRVELPAEDPWRNG